MRWQQRVRVVTGLSCTRIVLNLMIAMLLIIGWFTGYLVQIGLVLCLFYSLMFAMMFFCQRQRDTKLRELGDMLEELTTSWYFGASLLTLWLLSLVLQHHLLLLPIGVLMLAGPALVSLLMQEPESDSGDFPPEQNERR